MRPLTQISFCACVGLAVAITGCHKEKEYEGKVKLLRVEPVQHDDKGNTVSTDVDMQWIDCPGLQLQTMRSGLDFSKCIVKHKAGDVVPVKIHWEWDEHGHYDFHVIEVDGCKAPPVDDDDSSFDTAAECVPSMQHDAVVGFHCDRVPEGELVEKCPWFRVK